MPAQRRPDVLGIARISNVIYIFCHHPSAAMVFYGYIHISPNNDAMARRGSVFPFRLFFDD
jgi:hypothetical protein